MGIRGKRLDIIVLIILVGLDIIYGQLTHGTFWGKPTIVGILGLIPSIVYLGIRKKKNWKKIALATLIFGGFFGFIFEFRIDWNRAYITHDLLLPTVFGFLQLDNVLGHMMMACLIFVFYEHFIEHDLDHHISKNLPFALVPGIVVCVLLVLQYFFQPRSLNSAYPYFHLGIAAIIPPILLGFFRPKFIKNMAETAIFFFFLWLSYELLAVKLGYWTYPGNNYIGWVTLFGISFPIEELLFWMLFYAASLVSYYELAVDVHPSHRKMTRKKRRK